MWLAIIAACLAAVMFGLSIIGTIVGGRYDAMFESDSHSTVSYTGNCFAFRQRFRSERRRKWAWFPIICRWDPNHLHDPHNKSNLTNFVAFGKQTLLSKETIFAAS